MMKADGAILEQFSNILAQKHKRWTRWGGRRLDDELVSRGFIRTSKGGWRKYLDGSSIGMKTVSVHVVIPREGETERGVYHIDYH